MLESVNLPISSRLAASEIQIRRARPDDLIAVSQLLQEYFDLVDVMVRDEPAAVAECLQDERGGLWLASSGHELAGCIALRRLEQVPEGARAGEIKRLYVRSRFRRLGIAEKLLSALETYATSIGLRTLYLDTKSDLEAAIAFYQRAGYIPCERYNNNPQAALFMKRNLPPQLSVRDFQSGDEHAFWSLNEAWISKLFRLEEKDLQTLRQPEKYILSQGGRIFMACQDEMPVGCCALIRMRNGSYEVGKMGVAESERGKGVGRALLQHAIAEARGLGITRLYLETNQILKNAIHLYESVGFRHLDSSNVEPSPYFRANVFMEMILS